MKTQSNQKLDTYQVLGTKLRIRFDEVITQKEIYGDQHDVYTYNEAVCSIHDDRSKIIESIIGAKYSTGAELAAINNGGEEYEQYQAFRQQAKALADGWFE